MASVNKEVKRDKVNKTWKNKMIEFLMKEGVMPSYSTKKLAKLNMPSTFSGFGKTIKMKEFLSEMDINNDV